MYVDGYVLLAIYVIAVMALGISVYALWTLKEIEELYRKINSKLNNAWDPYNDKAKQQPRLKGPWK
jgi:hypothetical protein